MLIAALSTENKVVLAGMAAIFITFSLVSSFVLPRRNPNFPGERLNLFLGATAVLFVAMMLAVEFYAVEAGEEEEQGEALPALVRL